MRTGDDTPARPAGPAAKSRAPNFYQAVWALVRRIPRGRLMTYGQVATWLGSPRAARAVGYALMHLDRVPVPWHRVINARGQISIGGHLYRPDEQKRRLLAEGVIFDGSGTCDLRRLRWWPPEAKIRS